MQTKIERFTASNYYISQFYHLAVRIGMDANRMLEEIGVSPDIIDVPGRRVESEKLAAAMQGIWDFLQDEGLSLSTSKIPRGCFFTMGKLSLFEPRLKEALRAGMDFHGMVTDAYSVRLETDQELATLRFELKNPELDEEHLLTEYIILAWHRLYSWLIAENIPLTDVFFNYPPPFQVREYSYLFPGNHVFNAPILGFSFPKKFLDYINVQNPDSFRVFMEHCPVELYRQPRTDFSLAGDLQRLLIRRMNEGFPSVDEVARMVNMTRRTLIRKLKLEGSSYQKIKDRVRRDRILYLLTQTTLSVGEIAEKVGFSDSAVFARAFKTWTGFSPSEYRSRYTRGKLSG